MIGEIHSDGGAHAHRNKPSELTYKIERDSQTWRTSLWLPEDRRGEKIVGEFGIDIYTLICLKWITNKDLLYSTQNSAQGHVVTWMGWDGSLGENRYMGFPGGWAGKESICNAGDLGSIPELGRSPGEGKGYPLQYSGLENSIDYIVHGVAKSQTRLNDFHFHFQIHIYVWLGSFMFPETITILFVNRLYSSTR